MTLPTFRNLQGQMLTIDPSSIGLYNARAAQKQRKNSSGCFS